MAEPLQEQNLLKLAESKRSLLAEILRITETTEFKETSSVTDADFEAEAERFAYLYEKRQDYFEQISDIQSALSAAKPGSTQEQEKASSIETECGGIARKIIEIDKRNKEIGRAIHESVKKSMKSVKQEKNLNTRFDFSNNETGGFMVDKKN